MKKLVPDYSPTVHQLEETRRINIAFLRSRSQSFDKLVRCIASLCGVAAPAIQG
jgi:hypothetical protein